MFSKFLIWIMKKMAKIKDIEEFPCKKVITIVQFEAQFTGTYVDLSAYEKHGIALYVLCQEDPPGLDEIGYLLVNQQNREEEGKEGDINFIDSVVDDATLVRVMHKNGDVTWDIVLPDN